jgi:hypothetical protein
MGSVEGGAEFPDLRVVALEDLLLHEEVDLERVARLIDRLSADGILKNPPIVASLSGSHRFMLLDGANRVSALANLEVPHLLVQVVAYDDPGLTLSHWNHVVRDLETASFVEKARTIAGVCMEEGSPDDPVAERYPDYLCTIAFSETRALHLCGGRDLAERVAYLRELTHLYYRGPARMDRVNHANFEALRHHYQHFGAIFVFPDFGKQEIRAIAESGDRMPSGITRILVPRRVLGFNIQLAVLKSQLPLEEKQVWLEEKIAEKVAERKVRYYPEPVFIFDE